MELLDVSLAGYIKHKEEPAEAIKEPKNCTVTPWTNLDREPQLCQFFYSKSNSRTENPFESAPRKRSLLPDTRLTSPSPS